MDKDTQSRLDSLFEDELRRGFRVKELPVELQVQLKVDGLPVIERVRFTRLNPRRKSKIADAVQRRYHKDLDDPGILSNAKIIKLVEERGEWTTETSARMLELTDSVNRLQGELYLEGIGEEDWGADRIKMTALLREEISKAEYTDKDEQVKVEHVLDRWSDYMPSRRGAYTALYAAEQDAPEYSPDKDMAWLLDRLPSQEASEALSVLDDLRDKAIRFLDLQEKRTELAILQTKHAKIFADSVESRRDQSEEMARVYFCTEIVDAEDNPQGPLCKVLDDLWDFPEEVIRWLIIEHYFFANGMPDAAREYLETFGFLRADRELTEPTAVESGELAPSVESLDPQSSKGDTPQPAEMVVKSSE